MTLAMAYDIDAIHEKGQLLPISRSVCRMATPCTSTIVFVVRRATPGHQDWDDLVKPGISVITPNPPRAGRAGILAAWGTLAEIRRRRAGEF